MESFIFAIGVMLFSGALVALITLIPPIRRWCRDDLAARIFVICLVGLAAFVLGGGLFTRLETEVTFVFGTWPQYESMTDPGAATNKPQIIRELWLRALIPPTLRRTCYSEEAWICNLADDLTLSVWGEERSSHWPMLLPGSVSVMVSSVLAWVFTRKR